jgi:hypothetical protein
MFYSNTSLTTFSSDLPNLVDGRSMFFGCKLKSFSSDLPSLVCGDSMFGSNDLTTFSADLSNLISAQAMFGSCMGLESFSSDLPNLINGNQMFANAKLNARSVRHIANSIRDIAAEKKPYEDGTIPYLTYVGNEKWSASRGFVSDGRYVYTYNKPTGSYSTTIRANFVGNFILAINVTNNASTVNQQLKDFAEEAKFSSWDALKQHFVNKGWNVMFKYSGTGTTITYALRNEEQIIPCSIFAKLIEVDEKFAEYCNKDNSSFYIINWGHDATDLTDCEQFASLEEAIEHFNVKPIERN